MPINEILKEAKEKGHTTVSSSQMQSLMDKVAQLTRQPLELIREKRVSALSAESSIVLG